MKKIVVSLQTAAVFFLAAGFALGQADPRAQMISPTPGSTLPGATVTFSWSPAAGGGDYFLRVGSAAFGTDIFNAVVRVTSVTIINIPTNGGTIYVALFTQLKGAWSDPFQYTYTAANTGPAPKTTLAAVTNGASYGKSSVAPGQIVTLFGTGMGPASLAYNAPDAGNRFPASLAGVRILFNGVPAPLIYISDKQSAAIVPFEMAGQAVADVVVEYNGSPSAPMTFPVTNTMPGVFAADASGSGLGAIQNSDLSYNSAANPASPGSTIVLYVSGLGLLSPAQPNGSIVVAPLPVLTYPASVTIAGQTAAIVYAGPAPQAVAGLYQINCVVPAGVASGQAPVVVTADGRQSQPNLTVAIR